MPSKVYDTTIFLFLVDPFGKQCTMKCLSGNRMLLLLGFIVRYSFCLILPNCMFVNFLIIIIKYNSGSNSRCKHTLTHFGVTFSLLGQRWWWFNMHKTGYNLTQLTPVPPKVLKASVPKLHFVLL